MSRKDKRNEKENIDITEDPDMMENIAKEMAGDDALPLNDTDFAQKCDEGANQGLSAEQLLIDLEKATALQEEYLTMAQRVQADFDNFRRRNNSVRADAYEEGARDFAKTLLPVLDNLERAIEAGQSAIEKGIADKALLDGVLMVQKQLLETFEKRGIEIICRIGEKFDPNLENAVLQGTSEEGEAGTVCEVFQKGYKLGNSVLRHAMVKVVPE